MLYPNCQNFCFNLTQWGPVGDESVSELSPTAVVLQLSDEGGGRAGGPTQLTQLRHTLAVLPESAHQPVSGGQVTHKLISTSGQGYS